MLCYHQLARNLGEHHYTDGALPPPGHGSRCMGGSLHETCRPLGTRFRQARPSAIDRSGSSPGRRASNNEQRHNDEQYAEFGTESHTPYNLVLSLGKANMTGGATCAFLYITEDFPVELFCLAILFS